MLRAAEFGDVEGVREGALFARVVHRAVHEVEFLQQRRARLAAQRAAHAYATCFDAVPPPPALATRTASSHIDCARYIFTADFQSPASTNRRSASR